MLKLPMYVDFKPGVRKGFAGLKHVTSNGCPGQLARSSAIVPGPTTQALNLQETRKSKYLRDVFQSAVYKRMKT